MPTDPITSTVTETWRPTALSASLTVTVFETPTVIPTPASTLPIPTLTATPITVNSVPTSEFVVLPDDALAHVRDIFAKGQVRGRDPHVFSKVGDSVALTSHYLIKFDTGLYDLGEYAYLQRVIDHFAGSYGRYGVAIHVGLTARGILDPLWANKEWCLPNESVLACEIRLNNPSLLIIRIGSNDNLAPDSFAEAMREVVSQTIESGVIPIIATKADRFEGEGNDNNEILREIAADFQIPLWDFDRVAATLPNHGLSPDGIHLTISETNDYTQPSTFEYGYPISDLTALMMLDVILTEVIE